MRRMTFALVLGAAWFVAMLTTNACGVVSDTQRLVKVYGTITDASTNAALADVTVDAGTSVSESTTTGTYTVYPNANARIDIVFKKHGFKPLRRVVETRQADVRFDIAMSPER
jgi:hypothetical protein